MNKIVASVGLVALGAASVHAQTSMPGPTAAISGPSSKWWSISTTVQGFYDDNANTAATGQDRANTWGYNISPSIGVNVGNAQTTFSAIYIYNLLYYARPISTPVTGNSGVPGQTTRYDQDHTFNMALDHAFSERYSVHVTDSFVAGQEPDSLRAANNDVTVFQRIPGNNIVNSAGITFDGELTPVLGFEAGYNNSLYDYDASELSGPLNRDENYAHIDLRLNVAHQTVGVLGYQFGEVVYTGSGEFANPYGVANSNLSLSIPPSLRGINVRDTMSHTLYVGADHTFLPNLVGSVRVGATYYDYYNDPGTSDFGPYASASLTYTYAAESSFGIGFQEGRNASSLISQTTASLVHDTETSVVYGSIIHRIVPKLYGSLKGTFQNSTYHGGGAGIDGQSDRFFEGEADLEYKFNSYFSVHGGYDYDRLISDLAFDDAGSRNYDRNRFYLGATARY